MDDMKLTKGTVDSGAAAKDVQEIIRLKIERAALVVTTRVED